jgi:dipeptidase
MKLLQPICVLALLFIALPALSCTSYLVTRGASVDGSTMISYAADSHIRYGELYFRQGGTFAPGAMVDVRDRSTNRLITQIPQAPVTYTAVGYMNEHQVSMGETTFGGRKELRDSTGLMDYAALMFMAIDRSRTAREAILTIANLVDEYGYYSSGESFSIADKNEVWIMEIVGKGTRMVTDRRTKTLVNADKGAVWVAMRIPDGYISAHANHARIMQFPLHNGTTSINSRHLKLIHEPGVEVVYAHDVIDFARQKGYFNGTDKEFSFSDVYAPVDFTAARFCELRVWSFFRKFHSDMEQYKNYAAGYELKNRMPLWIKPERKLSVQDLLTAKRDHMQGTEFCMTLDPGAGPHALPYRWRPLTWEYDGKEYFHERVTVTQQTGFSYVAQARNWLPDPIGGISWFSVDDAGTTVYVPMYCGMLNAPESYAEGNGDILSYSPTSAFWAFNKVANFSYLRYDLMSRDIRALQSKLESSFFEQVPVIDKKASALYEDNPLQARRVLTDFSVQQANNTVEQWKELFTFLLVKYLDGNVKHEKEGEFIRNPHGYPVPPKHVEYPNEWKKGLIEATGEQFLVR